MSPFLTFGYGALLCPECKGHNLHHIAVVVFDRPDNEKAHMVTSVQRGRISTAITDGTGNPSSERQGVVVMFTCENCHDPIGQGIAEGHLTEADRLPPFEMTIAQHEGCTIIGWRALS